MKARRILLLLLVLGVLALLVVSRLPSTRQASYHAAMTGSIHLALGTPVDDDPSDDDVMVRPQYALSFNHKLHGTNWVSWHLDRSSYGSTPRREGRFLPDPALPREERATQDDYKNSGYARGHLVPSDDRTASIEDNDATFFLSNVLPMANELNIGPWSGLEHLERKLAQREGHSVFVMAGPLFQHGGATIGRHAVPVPVSYWKVVVVLDQGATAVDVTPRTVVYAVIMPNASSVQGEPWTSYQTTLGEVEHRSGYHLLGQVSRDVVKALETTVARADR